MPGYVSVVVPVFNNADSLKELVSRLDTTLSAAIGTYELIFVDDGSRDESRAILRALSASDARIKLVALSRNFGHQVAITAGCDVATGDAVVVMDADLQDPPEVLSALIAKWRDGYDVAYGVRLSRLGDSRFKRWTAAIFYRLLRRLTSTEVALDSGDFRLLSRRAMDALNGMRERHRFVRGMVSWLGYRQVAVPYHRAPRVGGQSQYSLGKLLQLALDGIVSFSTVPLRITTWLGFLGAAISLAYSLFAITVKILWGVPLQGWTSLVTVVVFIGSVQLLVLGVIGEYVGRMYEEVKGRPLYLVAERHGFGDGQ